MQGKAKPTTMNGLARNMRNRSYLQHSVLVRLFLPPKSIRVRLLTTNVNELNHLPSIQISSLWQAIASAVCIDVSVDGALSFTFELERSLSTRVCICFEISNSLCFFERVVR